jgi:TPR repeat protein
VSATTPRTFVRNKVTPASLCTVQHPDDCTAIAARLEYGGGGFTADPPRAAVYYRIACDAGDLPACTGLADLYLDGRGVPKDAVEGMRLLRDSCGRGEGCMTYGFRLLDEEVPASRAEALALFAAICDGKRGNDDDRSSACFVRADRAPTVADGVPWYLKACAAEEERACSVLAKLYSEDQLPGGTPASNTRALEALCEEQNVTACDFASRRHDDGKGVPANHAEGARLRRKACELGKRRCHR